MLTVGELRFRYGARKAVPAPSSPVDRDWIIDGVSLSIDRGDLVGILGPNGSGKTTLLRLIGGSLKPTSGSVRLDGQEVSTVAKRALAARLAVVPQETHLTFEYTALEMVLMGRYPRLRAFEIEGPDDLASAHEALEATGAAHLTTRAFTTLSGGEKQRVIIASALAQLDDRLDAGRETEQSRQTLLLDEPTASLDLRYQLEIGALVRRLHQNRDITVVLSTHDLRFAAAVCTRLIMFARGRVLADGPPEGVLTPGLVGELYEIGAEAAAPVLAR